MSQPSMSAFADEMRKQALLGTLATLPVKLLLGKAALEKQKETQRLKDLRKMLTRGDKTEVHIMDKTNPAGPHYNKDSKGVQYVGVRKDEDPAILAHELGHSELDREVLGRILQSLPSRLLFPAGSLAGYAIARGGEPTIGAVIAAASSLPILTYEGMASLRAVDRLKRVGATDEELSAAKKKLLQAWGSYATLPVEAAGNAATFSLLTHLERGGGTGSRSLPRTRATK